MPGRRTAKRHQPGQYPLAMSLRQSGIGLGVNDGSRDLADTPWVSVTDEIASVNHVVWVSADICSGCAALVESCG